MTATDTDMYLVPVETKRLIVITSVREYDLPAALFSRRLAFFRQGERGVAMEMGPVFVHPFGAAMCVYP